MPGDRIFISYRRGIDNDSAGRLYDRLEIAFGEDRLFRDVDASRDMAGLDFHEIIDSRVSECSAFVAVLGRGWMENADRLRSDNDFVRIEIEAALKRDGIRVIPVLIEDVQMPAADDLPEVLRPLTRRGAVRLTNEGYSGGIEGLTDILRTTTEPAELLAEAAAPDGASPPSPAPPSRAARPEAPPCGPSERSIAEGVGWRSLILRFLSRRIVQAVCLPLIAALIWLFGPMIAFGDARPLESVNARAVLVAAILLIWSVLFLRSALLSRRHRLKADAPSEKDRRFDQAPAPFSPKLLGRAQLVAGVAICALSAVWLLSSIVLQGDLRTLRDELLKLSPAGKMDIGRLTPPPSPDPAATRSKAG